MIGGLQFKSLKEELVDSGSLTEKEFHDRTMRENSIPVALLRQILKGEDPAKKFEAEWRFYAK